MIISKIPLRISFCGGGSDIPFFIKEFGYGEVITTTIKKYIYTYFHNTYHQDSYFLKYSFAEKVKEKNEINHPVIKYLVLKYDLSYCELGSIADIPGKSGLGSSSAFTAALLAMIYTKRNIPWDKESIARETCEIEMNGLGEKIGYQDAYSCVFGSLNRFIFTPDGNVKREPINLAPEHYKNLEEHMFLIKTTFDDERYASKILKSVQTIDNFASQRKILDLVSEFTPALYRGDVRTMGRILDKNWEYKKSLDKGITNTYIDTLYEKLMNYGAYGGKLLGAGGAGFLLVLMPKDKMKTFTENFPLFFVEPVSLDSTGLSVLNL